MSFDILILSYDYKMSKAILILSCTRATQRISRFDHGVSRFNKRIFRETRCVSPASSWRWNEVDGRTNR